MNKKIVLIGLVMAVIIASYAFADRAGYIKNYFGVEVSPQIIEASQLGYSYSCYFDAQGYWNKIWFDGGGLNIQTNSDDCLSEYDEYLVVKDCEYISRSMNQTVTVCNSPTTSTSTTTLAMPTTSTTTSTKENLRSLSTSTTTTTITTTTMIQNNDYYCSTIPERIESCHHLSGTKRTCYYTELSTPRGVCTGGEWILVN